MESEFESFLNKNIEKFFATLNLVYEKEVFVLEYFYVDFMLQTKKGPLMIEANGDCHFIGSKRKVEDYRKKLLQIYYSKEPLLEINIDTFVTQTEIFEKLRKYDFEEEYVKQKEYQ